MAQPVTAILSRQGELAARAMAAIHDANEAGLLVGRVISAALQRNDATSDEMDIGLALNRDLDRLLARLRRRPD